MSTYLRTFEDLLPEDMVDRTPEPDPDAERPAFRTLVTPMTREQMEMAIAESERQYDALMRRIGR